MFSSNWVITNCKSFNLKSSGLDFFIFSSSSSIMTQFEMIALQSPPACGSVCENSVFSVFFPRVLQPLDHWCSFARSSFIALLFLHALHSTTKIFSSPLFPPSSCSLYSLKVMLPWELSCPPSGDSNHLFNSSWPWVPSLQSLR